MLKLLFVFIGGGLGSMSRYGITKVLDYRIFEFPLATLISNTLACMVLGYFLGLEIKSGISDSTRILIITGFCGGFSTFSTFSAESMKLINSGQYGLAMLNIALSLIVCIVFIYIGMKISELL